MTLLQQTNVVLWVVLLVVWSIGFFGNKRTLKHESRFDQYVVIVLLILSGSLMFSPGSTPALAAIRVVPGALGFAWLGVGLTALGVAFAIWARVTLGKNWSGAVVTVKERHELVTRGPYAFVRHPIYSGFLLAALGTVMTNGDLGGLIGFALMVLAFALRIPREERFMTEQFPADYPSYKKRVKTIVPFIF